MVACSCVQQLTSLFVDSDCRLQKRNNKESGLHIVIGRIYWEPEWVRLRKLEIGFDTGDSGMETNLNAKGQVKRAKFSFQLVAEQCWFQLQVEKRHCTQYTRVVSYWNALREEDATLKAASVAATCNTGDNTRYNANCSTWNTILLRDKLKSNCCPYNSAFKESEHNLLLLQDFCSPSHKIYLS